MAPLTSPPYAATVRAGALATGGPTSPVNPDQLIIDMMRDVWEYDSQASPLMTIITKRMNVRPASQTTVRHLEDEPLPEWDTTTASVTNVATTVPVTNGTYHRVGDLIAVPRTGEQVRVTAVAGNNLTVTRAWAGSGTAMNSGEQLINLGAAEEEGALSPTAKQTITVTKTNFTQIVRTPVHVTKTNDAVDQYLGSERNRQRRKAGGKHSRKWEQIAIHGRKKEDVSTGTNPIRSAGGLDEYISSNVLTASGALTEPEFVDWIGDCFRFNADGTTGTKTKLLIGSRELLGNMWSWGAGKLQVNNQASMTYGVEISNFICQYGRLAVLNHPLLEAAYAGYGYVVDVDGMFMRPLRPTKLFTEIQQNGEDAWKDEYLTEASFSFALEAAFGKITGVTF